MGRRPRKVIWPMLVTSSSLQAVAKLRIERAILIDPDTGCWNWTKTIDQDGYARLAIAGGKCLGHRVAYLVYRGNPGSLHVCHSCDNPPCVNPEHLFLGTHADNCLDSWRKGRRPKLTGTTNGQAKLTEAKVKKIGKLSHKGWSDIKLAELFGVSAKAIYDIRTGATWRHL